MRAVVFTLGCKVNEVESASIMASLEKLGWQTSDRLSPADIYILNTCAVTAEAERKSRQLVARAKKFNPEARVYVIGCASEKNGGQFAEKGVSYVGGARDKQNVLAAISRDFGGECPLSLEPPKQVRTRAFIKIEDGCNNFCSYCIIPYLRGRVQSRPAEEIIAEVNGCAAPEIVLTGINISAYDDGGGLAGLIRRLAFSEKRIRLGSIECNIIDDDLLGALSELYDFAPQFHLSLQSGSDAVLRAMNRKYTRAQYLEKCALIYRRFPDAAITTDIIAGFPAESEKDFADSLSIIDEAGFARVHVFAFSPREGTAAWKMKDIPPDVKSRRLHMLLQRAGEAEERYIGGLKGKTFGVIFEDFDGQYTDGYTGSYVKIYAPGRHEGRGEVTVERPFKDGVLVREKL